MKVFVISLKESTDRQESIKTQLNPLNVEWNFFDAIDGRKGLPERLEKYQADNHRKYFRNRPLSPGQKGCYASHYLLWEKCVQLNEPILILEDDVVITPFFKNIHSHLPTLHLKYDYIKVDPSNSEFKKIEFDGNLQLVQLLKNFDGACGYSISPKAAKQFIMSSEKWTSPVDGFIGESYKNRVTSYSLVTYAVYPIQQFGNKDSSFLSTIKNYKENKTPLFFKLLREVARLIRSIRILTWNIRAQRSKK